MTSACRPLGQRRVKNKNTLNLLSKQHLNIADVGGERVKNSIKFVDIMYGVALYMSLKLTDLDFVPKFYFLRNEGGRGVYLARPR